MNYWIRNVKNFGCISRPTPKYNSKKRKKKYEEELLRAKGEIEEIKKQCKDKSDMAFKLTGPKLATKLGVCQSTANKYLRILEGRWSKVENTRINQK